MHLRLSLLFAAALLTLGCAASSPGPASNPVAAPAANSTAGQKPSIEESTPVRPEAASGSMPGFLARMMASRPGAKAAPAVTQEFGRLVGTWACKSAQRQQDGTFKEQAKESIWTWFYTLDGTAIQDVWEGAPGGIGTNLRVYDPEQSKWNIVWATTGQTDISQFTAVGAGPDIIMTGEQPARAPFPAHQARVTFYDITEANFSWKYEGGAPGGGTQWQEVSRISCRRTEGPAA